MKVITLLTIFFVGWIIYSLLQSNMSIQKELREMRMQCMSANSGNYNSISNAPQSSKSYHSSPSSSSSYGMYDNNALNLLKTSLISSLKNMLPNNN